MIVLDASAAIEFLLRTQKGLHVEERIADPLKTLHAPHLLDLEVIQVLRRYVHSSELTETRASIALEDFADLDIQRYPHQFFTTEIWALRHNVTAYDASYIVLADALDATLLTMDQALEAHITDNGPNVELL